MLLTVIKILQEAKEVGFASNTNSENSVRVESGDTLHS